MAPQQIIFWPKPLLEQEKHITRVFNQNNEHISRLLKNKTMEEEQNGIHYSST